VHQTIRAGLPVIESGTVYRPDTVAETIVNFEEHPLGGLRAVRGPAAYLPDYDLNGVFHASYGKMHGIYHAALQGGMRDVLLVRTGTKLLVQQGTTYETLTSALSDEGNVEFPDQFCEVGGVVVWTNGTNAPLVYNGEVLTPLGYDKGPPVPLPFGPDQVATSNSENPGLYRNSGGYSHPGRIGTPGDVLAGQDGCLRAGAWYYWGQWMDMYGNVSPLSPVSVPVTLRTENTATEFEKKFLAWDTPGKLGNRAVNLDDLTRQFFVGNLRAGRDGTMAYLLYRSPDTYYNPTEPRLLAMIPGNVDNMVYPDNHSDAELSSMAQQVIPVPHFKIMCAYGGGLAIANLPSDPGMVRVSEIGQAGTFLRDKWVYPDPNGAAVTGLAYYNKKLYAFTVGNIFEITETTEGGLYAVPLQGNQGCVAPSSLQVVNGVLVWLGYDGFYAMNASGVVTNITVQYGHQQEFAKLNKAKFSQAAAVFSPETQEYLCAVTPAGSVLNTSVFCFNGSGWKRREYGLHFASMTLTKDLRQLVLAAGALANGDTPNVYALNAENRHFTPPAKTYKFRTGWLRMDPLGRDRFNVATIYVGFRESANTQLQWTTYQNGRMDKVQEGATGSKLTMVAPDLSDILDAALYGTAKARNPRVFWRRADVKLTGVDSFAFALSGSESTGARPDIVGFMFDATPTNTAGTAAPRG
jgi:hypothetical protein